MANILKLKRHGTFSIREGWYSKGINAIANNKDEKVFSKNNGTKLLGIGSNMVTSLKYWMLASNSIEYKNRNYELTEFGRIIKKYDPYLEDDFVWTFIHYFLVTNIDESPVFYMIQNKIDIKFLTLDYVYEYLSNYFLKKEIDFKEDSLKSDISMYFKTYASTSSNGNPEENNYCPLSTLNLLKEDTRGTFIKTAPAFNDLNYLVIYYFLSCNIENDSFVISDVINLDKSPNKIFNITDEMLLIYLDKIQSKKLITINKTAGLNTVYFNQRLTLEEIFSRYFLGENANV